MQEIRPKINKPVSLYKNEGYMKISIQLTQLEIEGLSTLEPERFKLLEKNPEELMRYLLSISSISKIHATEIAWSQFPDMPITMVMEILRWPENEEIADSKKYLHSPKFQ